MNRLNKALIISAIVAGTAYLAPSAIGTIKAHLESISPHYFPWPYPPSRHSPPQPPPYHCPQHNYTTQLISLDPLLIYITNFIPANEAALLMDLGTPLLTTSPITGSGADTSDNNIRTSTSAPLPADDSAVSCVLSRARSFLGPAVLDPTRDDMGAPQMVRYTAGQRFNVHADWFARPRLGSEDAAAGRRRLYNRVATIFVVLQSNASAGGETWFPHVEINGGVSVGGGSEEGEVPAWRVHDDGGLAFRPVAGNGLFWVNLLPNGTGDARVVHAGLPIVDGVKTGMNIWPRAYFGPDA